MSEVIFECYSAPSLAYGVDSLFSYYYNGGQTGLVVSSSYSSTHMIPVLNSKPLLSHAARLNWGGSQSAEYLLKLLRLKYPALDPRCKLSALQTEHMIKDHCYLAKDYNAELSTYLDWTGLEDRDVIMQYPYTEEVIVQKTEEELAIQAQKKAEAGQRLREQNAKRNLEKLVKNEEELEYYRDVSLRLSTASKKEAKRILEAEEFKDEKALERLMKELEIKIRKKRIGGPEVEEEPQEEPDYSILAIPDEELDEAGLKQKRHLRLMKSNHDARARAKAEKEAEKARVAEEQRLDEEKRTNDLEGWLRDRHAQREAALQKIRDRERLKADLGNRKSLASQNRMKSIANLASDAPTKKRRRGGDDDTFGADDDDWAVYRQIATHDASDDEQEEDPGEGLRKIEKELLEFDPSFTEQHTHDAQTDWSTSLLHAFLRGARPFDVGSAREAHQIHLNVERIRVPEVIFQPSIAGVDQAGIVEIAADILGQRLGVLGAESREAMLRDIFVTGGNSLFKAFEERFHDGLRANLAAGADVKVRRAGDAVGDAWRGAARWVGSESWKNATTSREEWLEKGPDYLKVCFGKVLFVHD